MDLQNDYTTGDNRYPKNRQQTLHLPDKYSKTIMPQGTQSEGASFAQKAGRNKTSKSEGRNGSSSVKSNTYDREYWKDKKFFKCDEPGNPSTHCPNDEDDDEKSRSSQAKGVKKLESQVKNIKRHSPAQGEQEGI
jgi:hypothetical protein